MPMVLLENVKNLASAHVEVLSMIVTKLESFGYRVWWKVLNALDYGVPQNRERIFIVAVLKEYGNADFADFKWPEPMPRVKITSILDPLTEDERTAGSKLNNRKPPATQTVARANLKRGLDELKSCGVVDPSKVAVVMDIDSSKLHMMYDKSPCLTCSRARSGGYWVSSRGRRFTMAEMLRLQGVEMNLQQPDTVTDNQFGQIVGNGIPVPMLSCLLSELLQFTSWTATT